MTINCGDPRRIFGPHAWGNHPNQVLVETPTGSPCQLCETAILADDLGLFMVYDGGAQERPWHRDCFVYSIFGLPEDERGSVRETARAATERVDRNRQRQKDMTPPDDHG